MKRFITSTILLLCCADLYALTVSGRVTESESGKAISGVSVAIEELKMVTITDAEGSFRFDQVDAGYYTVITAHPLYGNRSISIRVKREFKIDIELSEKTYEAGTVLNKGKGVEWRPGSQYITSDDIKLMPMSSPGDSLRLLQSLPGVGSSFTLSSVPVIRGLNPVYDRVYIDDLPVYYPYHYLPPAIPLLSSINETVIDRATIIKGPGPLFYDDCIGSVIQVKTKEVDKPGINGGIILDPALPTIYCEAAPIPDLTILFAGRRSYVDLLYGAVDINMDNELYLQDHYLKARYNLFSDHRLYFISTGSKDFINNDSIEAGTSYITEAFRWQYLINNRFLLDTSFMYNSVEQYFREKDKSEEGMELYLNFNPSIYRLSQTLNASLDMVSMKTGYDFTVHDGGVSGTIMISDFVNSRADSNSADQYYPIEGVSFSLFNETLFSLDPFSLNLGARYKYFGPLENHSLSYRAMASYTNSSYDFKLYAGGGSYRACPDMYYYAGGMTGKPELAESWNAVLGMEKRIAQWLTGQVESYYSGYDNLFYSDMSEERDRRYRRYLQINPFSQDRSGKAWGIECFLKGDYGRFHGWISYALSASKMSDGSSEYSSDYEQTHILRVMFEADLGRWVPSAAWHYYSLMPYTPITGSAAEDSGEYSPVYGEYNSESYGNHHRLDAKLTYRGDGVRFYVEVTNLFYVDGYDSGKEEFKTNDTYLFPLFDTGEPYSSSNPTIKKDIVPVFAWIGWEICF